MAIPGISATRTVTIAVRTAINCRSSRFLAMRLPCLPRYRATALPRYREQITVGCRELYTGGSNVRFGSGATDLRYLRHVRYGTMATGLLHCGRARIRAGE